MIRGGHGEKRHRRQEAAIAALLTEPTVERAAARAGVGYRTLKAWLHEPTFQRAFRAARREIVETTIGQIQQATGRAVRALVRNFRCGKPAAEIRAAAVILEHSLRALQLTDLAERIEDLERQQCGRGAG